MPKTCLAHGDCNQTGPPSQSGCLAPRMPCLSWHANRIQCALADCCSPSGCWRVSLAPRSLLREPPVLAPGRTPAACTQSRPKRPVVKVGWTQSPSGSRGEQAVPAYRTEGCALGPESPPKKTAEAAFAYGAALRAAKFFGGSRACFARTALRAAPRHALRTQSRPLAQALARCGSARLRRAAGVAKDRGPCERRRAQAKAGGCSYTRARSRRARPAGPVRLGAFARGGRFFGSSEAQRCGPPRQAKDCPGEAGLQSEFGLACRRVPCLGTAPASLLAGLAQSPSLLRACQAIPLGTLGWTKPRLRRAFQQFPGSKHCALWTRTRCVPGPPASLGGGLARQTN